MNIQMMMPRCKRTAGATEFGSCSLDYRTIYELSSDDDASGVCKDALLRAVESAMIRQRSLRSSVVLSRRGAIAPRRRVGCK